MGFEARQAATAAAPAAAMTATTSHPFFFFAGFCTLFSSLLTWPTAALALFWTRSTVSGLGVSFSEIW
jgi:hypothetical protein